MAVWGFCSDMSNGTTVWHMYTKSYVYMVHGTYNQSTSKGHFFGGFLKAIGMFFF